MRKRTWYGAIAVIEIEPGKPHRAGFGRFLIPHPPVANWLLRRGLSKSSYKKLCLAHEIGHFQMMPFEFLYSIVLSSLALAGEHDIAIVTWFWIVVCSLATWEIFAELQVILLLGRDYLDHYQDISLFPRMLFWSISTFLIIGGWVYVFL